jgi:butyrate response factor
MSRVCTRKPPRNRRPNRHGRLGGAQRNEYSKNSNYNNKKRPDLYKTQLCNTFEEFGECKYCDNCQYAHGKHELREKPEIVRPSAYKTVRCKNYWSENSICPYGEKCEFVHEEAFGINKEKVNDNKKNIKYKTKECKTFNKVGVCPYGVNCSFIHKKDTKCIKRTLSEENEKQELDRIISSLNDDEKEKLNKKLNEYKESKNTAKYIETLACLTVEINTLNTESKFIGKIFM